MQTLLRVFCAALAIVAAAGFLFGAYVFGLSVINGTFTPLHLVGFTGYGGAAFLLTVLCAGLALETGGF